MRNKLTKKQIEEIKRLKEKGKTYREIAKDFNISANTVYYHYLSDEERKEKNKQRVKYFRNLSLELRQRKYQKQKEYQKNYRRERYKQDPIFREKEKKYQREYQKRKYQERKKNK